VSAAGPCRANRSAGSLPSGSRAYRGVEAVWGKDPQVAFGGDPAGEISVGGHDRVLAVEGELAGLLIGQGGASGATPTLRPLLARVAALASMGPSTITGTPPALRCCSMAPQLSALVEERSVGRFEVFRSAAVRTGAVGCRRPTKPRTSPLWMIGKTTRSRNRSI
jgi:hypothetical protein